MKLILSIFLGLYAAVMIVACGSSGNSNTVVDPYAAGYVYPPTNPYYPGYDPNALSSAITFNATNYNQATLQITNNAVFMRFLKEAMGICDRGWYNGGSASCTSYTNAYVLATFQAASTGANAARLTLQVVPRYQSTPYFFTIGYNYSAYYSILPLDMAVSVINNSQGIEARSYGGVMTMSANKLFQFIVENGKLEHSYMDFKLAYDGQAGGVFMTGRMNRQ